MFNKELITTIKATPWDPRGNNSLTGELFTTPQMITLQKNTGSLQGSNGQQSTSTDPQQATQTVPSAAATQIQRLQGATAKRLRDKATTLHADLTSDEPLPKANKIFSAGTIKYHVIHRFL